MENKLNYAEIQYKQQNDSELEVKKKKKSVT